MPDTERSLRIQWKGVTTGPYTRIELDDMLERGEVSLVHRLEFEGRWQSVSEFLDRNRLRIRAIEPNSDPTSEELRLPSSSSTPPVASIRRPPHLGRLEKLVLIGYILCGTTFVLPIIASLPALWIAFRLQSIGVREPARLQFILCGVFTILGLIFHALLFYARNEGLV
ncbi:MAG: hypothetical protein LBV12_10820 [Puniceicoccales bacterium]|jgi:hypothetical protein|nr:hypothetical protein [Puniceicoccales bacterium]